MDEKELNELRNAIAGLKDDLAGLGNSSREAGDKFSGMSSGMANASQKSAEATANFQKQLGAAYQGLKNFASGVHNAAMDVEGGQSKWSGAFNSVAGAASGVAKQFGPLGKAIGYTIDAYNMAAQAVMKQNDAIFKSYNDLGKFGGTLRLSTDQVLTLGIKAGYSSKNLESLYKSAKSLDTGLVQLGGSTSEGIKAFAEVANVGEEARNNFRALGYSQEEVTEMQATYVKQLGATGGLLAKTPRQLSEESQKYIYNLTALAEITGKSVKEQQKAQEVAMQQQNLNAFVNNLEQKRIDALASGNKVEAERLEKQISSTKAYAAHIVATEDAETAAAKLESIATDGAVVLGKNNAQLAGMGYDLNKVNDALRRGESPMKMYFMNAEENNKVQKNARQMFGENLYRLGDVSRGLQNFAGQSNEARAAQAAYNKYLTLSEEEKRKIDSMSETEAIKALTAGKAETDGRLDAEQKRQEAEMRYRQAVDEFTNILSKAVNPALGMMADFLKLVSKGLNALVKGMYFIGDAFDSMKEWIEDIVMGSRDNIVFRKLFGLEKVTDKEKADVAEKRALRQKEIKERDYRLSGEAAAAEQRGAGGTQAQAQAVSSGSGGSTAPAGPSSSGGGGGGGSATAKSASAPSAPGGASPPTTGGSAEPAASGGGQKTAGTRGLDVVIGNTVRKGGTVSWRTNNPGNISYAEITKKHGALAPFINPNGDAQQRSVGIAIMPTLEAGENAQMELWRRPLYNTKSIDAAVNTWTGGHAGFGSTYAKDLAKAAGVDINTTVKDLTDGQLRGLVKKQAIWEGFKQGIEVSAKDGAMLNGPMSGYPVKLTAHGSEAVVPLDPNTLLGKLAREPISKDSNPTTNLMTESSSSEAIGSYIVELKDMMESKMELLISAIEDGNDTSDKILQYSRV